MRPRQRWVGRRRPLLLLTIDRQCRPGRATDDVVHHDAIPHTKAATARWMAARWLDLLINNADGTADADDCREIVVPDLLAPFTVAQPRMP